jgi:hypothetical protein
LERLEGEWDDFQTARDRDAVYGYLTAIFEVGTWWILERKAAENARRALSLSGHIIAVGSQEPFASLILCTADPKKVDYRTRSKWSRVLRYAAKRKRWDETLTAFVKRKGGINKCAGRFARRLGRGRPHQALGRIAK